jgi:hypothetical protein
MDFDDGYLVLGAGTRLAKVDRGEMSPRERARLLALLAAAHRRPIGPSPLRYVQLAPRAMREGDVPLAHMHIALSGLGKMAHPQEDARRLFIIDALMEGGVEPAVILKGLGVESADGGSPLERYSPDQPRVPAGNGRPSGRWTNGDSAEATNDPPPTSGPSDRQANESQASGRPVAAESFVSHIGPIWNIPLRDDFDELVALASDPSVKAAIETAWTKSIANPKYPQENGFFILRDPQTGAVSVQWVAPGFAGRLSMGAPPPSAIASFNTHPNPTGSPMIFNGKPLVENGEPQVWSPWPRAADLDAAMRWGFPGLVKSDQGLFFYGPNLRPWR